MSFRYDCSSISSGDGAILDKGPLASITFASQTGANAVPAGRSLKIALPSCQVPMDNASGRMHLTPFFLLRHVLQPSDLPGTPTMSQRGYKFRCWAYGISYDTMEA